jgi:SecD/SecF fusion protein
MVENLGRKLTTIFVLLAISIGLLTIKDVPLNLGLDLQGGTRITLSIDIEGALAEGTINQAEADDPVALLNQMISIFRKRIDPYGTREPIIRTEGENRIVIEMPGNTGLKDRQASAPMMGALDLSGDFILLGEGSQNFPAGGGVVLVGSEEIRYVRVSDITEMQVKDVEGVPTETRMVVGQQLVQLTRGVNHSTASAHSEGEIVKLASTNEIRNAIENLGRLAFHIVAIPTDYSAWGTDSVAEENKVKAWIAANPESAVERFNAVAAADGGPSENILWFVDKDDFDNPRPTAERVVPMLNMPNLGHEDWEFSGGALESANMSQDDLGLPAVGFQMKPERISDFTDFTEEHIGRAMAIVLNGEIESTANINGVLPGSGQIYGSFTSDYVNTLITVMRTGSLRVKPTVESEERVSATLGADYVRMGFFSCAVAIFGVIVFMLVYYRRFGIYAATALLSTLLMLLGALSFLNATLTLPGVAGIILTVGMAVDANILIFDRVREEMDKGRNIKQAAKNGFARAAVTIFDANITTLVTAVFLFALGSGPVKGFAVTLMVGVLTSMFSALVITKVMVDRTLEKGTKELGFGQWLVTANYSFMDKAKGAITGSIIAIIAGVTLFISLPDKDKLGIDFLGGATMTVRTTEAQDIDLVRELVAGIEGDIGGSDVTGVASESSANNAFRTFRITFKTAADSVAGDSPDTFKSLVNSALEGILLTQPLIANIVESTGATDVQLHFGEAHEPPAIQAILESAGMADVTVARSVGESSYTATGTVGGRTSANLTVDLTEAFIDADEDYTLVEPGADYSSVGKQVVGELRDDAILAILASLFMIIMYIRVRFAEYSYGFAAVAAVVHDVLITLGVLSVFMVTGIVHVEISVAMIAAFLTIIGYSLNDTIVLFDRVRENLPRMETGLADILNTSINQTLSRTILTSLTTLLAVTILLIFNFGTGNVLEGFALTMVIGVLVGTYSSVFIASPVLLHLETRSAAKRKVEKDAIGKVEVVPVK